VLAIPCRHSERSEESSRNARKNTGSYWVYILANKRNGTIYVGVTNSLRRRVWQHKNKIHQGFTKEYVLTLLVYFEEFRSPSAAIARETQIKGWLRKKKLALIESMNPNWDDLSAGWYDIPLDSSLRSE
jgi:putative endonuclease